MPKWLKWRASDQENDSSGRLLTQDEECWSALTALLSDPVISGARIPMEKLHETFLVGNGSGGNQVYKAALGCRTVAVKRLDAVHRQSIREVVQLLREAKLMAPMHHPNIIAFVGVAWSDAKTDVRVVMAFMAGGNLRALLDQRKQKNEEKPGLRDDKLAIARDIAKGLTYLHSLAPKVIHGDMRSHNVLLSETMEAALTGFGIALDESQVEKTRSRLWMAPEVLIGSNSNEKADIFSFGVLLSELDTNELPYAAFLVDSSHHRVPETALLQKVVTGEIRATFADSNETRVLAIARRCVDLDPAKRPSASEISDQLLGRSEHWIASPSPPQPQRQWISLRNLPLHQAARDGRKVQCRILIATGSSVNERDQGKQTPLHHAASASCLDMCQLLIEKGASPGAQNLNGWTPLHCAARIGHVEICDLLIKKGAVVHCQTHEGWTPLHVATRHGHLDVCRLLIKNDASPNAKNVDGWTPLYVAAREGQLEVCRLLVEKGASLDATNNDGWTPLNAAARGDRLEVCRFLVDKGTFVDAKTKEGFTPLHSAAQEGHLEVCRLLIEKGASIDFQGNDGSTPLFMAAEQGQADVCRLLIDKGASLEVRGFNGLTPWHVADQHHHVGTCALLLENGACADDGIDNTAPVAKKSSHETIKINGHQYRFSTSNVLDGRNTLVEAENTSSFGNKRVVIKIYQTNVTARAANEVDKLGKLLTHDESKRFIVEAFDFSDSASLHDENCSALVLQRGQKNLKQIVGKEGFSLHSQQVVATMQQIAQCLDYLHSQVQMVHGDVKLENVVNFGDDYPQFKLVDFENCCDVNEFMTMDCSPEYCPPELATHLVFSQRQPLVESSDGGLRAAYSFDVWCFGVLWMKYLVRGRVLVEFEDLSAQQIVTRVAEPDFDFEHTLQSLKVSQPMKDLIRECTRRDPTGRPSFHGILQSHVIRGFTSTLLSALSA